MPTDERHDVKLARLTGQQYESIYETECPHCSARQWNVAGRVNCAFCGELFQVTHLSAVPKDSGETPET